MQVGTQDGLQLMVQYDECPMSSWQLGSFGVNVSCAAEEVGFVSLRLMGMQGCSLNVSLPTLEELFALQCVQDVRDGSSLEVQLGLSWWLEQQHNAMQASHLVPPLLACG